jgi:ATP-dependent Clp protease ATP-binding subunit ClpA
MPELFNRIGKENVIVFDFIRDEVVTKILDRNIQNVKDEVSRLHKASLEISDEALAQLMAGVADYIENGGRGLANLTQDRLVNPLSRELFALEPLKPDTYTVTRFEESPSGWRAEVAGP